MKKKFILIVLCTCAIASGAGDFKDLSSCKPKVVPIPNQPLPRSAIIPIPVVVQLPLPKKENTVIKPPKDYKV